MSWNLTHSCLCSFFRPSSCAQRRIALRILMLDPVNRAAARCILSCITRRRGGSQTRPILWRRIGSLRQHRFLHCPTPGPTVNCCRCATQRGPMEASPVLFRDLTYIFLAAALGGLLAWRLRLPLILGFVLGGIVVSPFTPGPHLSDLHTFEVFAEVGVVLLMFSTGVEFSVPDLMRVKWVALIGAPLGIVTMVGVAIGVMKFAGWSITEGAVIGASVSVASTMVLVRLLKDSGKMTATFARVMIGITLVEDLAVICMTVVLPIVGSAGEGVFLKVAWTLGKALILLIPLVF